MNDGSVIAIASGSRVTIAEYRVGDGEESRDATLSLGEGLLRAVVSSPKGPPHFEVDTVLRLCARPTGSSKPSRGRRKSGCSRTASV
jgi:hypothetical protein